MLALGASESVSIGGHQVIDGDWGVTGGPERPPPTQSHKE